METTIERPAGLTLYQRAAVALGTAEHEIKLRELVLESAGILTVTNIDGREQAHRAAMTLRNARTSITATGKAAREDATAFSKAVIAEEKRLLEIILPEEERVFQLRDKFDAEVAAERQRKIDAERARVQRIQAEISALRSAPMHAASTRITAIEMTIVLMSESLPTAEIFEEFLPEAIEAHTAALAEMHALRVARIEADAAAAREKAEREAEAARLAAERLQIEQERAALAERMEEQERAAKAAREAAEAELKAARDKQAAEMAEERTRLANIRAMEDDARQFKLTQERQALEVQNTALRLERARLEALAAEQEAERNRLQDLAERAAAEARAGEERRAPAAEEQETAREFMASTPAARPDDREIIDLVASHFGVLRETAYEWLCEMDFTA